MKPAKRHLCLCLLLLWAFSTLAVPVDQPKATDSLLPWLMPKPVSAVGRTGCFRGDPAQARVQMVSDAELGTFDYPVAGFANEGYKLQVRRDGILITAASAVGVIRARQTLAQLQRPDGSIECCDITDYPAFKVRGFMHDVGRSYIRFSELKHEVDLLARFKVNLFHWHLTDHQGFRFESLSHPELNRKGFTRFVGQYYTQAECRELDAYAAERGMMVIPEIDMPGHSTAFEQATGCTMTSARGKAILKDVLRELAACFPHSPYIHIGADETHEGTAAFVREMADAVHSLGKKAVCWNPCGSGGPADPETMGIDMLTNWSTRGRLVRGVPNIDMRYFYVNHFDVFADLAGAYRSSIFGSSRGNASAGGVSIGIWNDRYLSDERQILAQNNVYAVTLAMAERAWVGAEGHQYIEQGGAYLPNAGRDYTEFCDWERRFLYYKERWLALEPIPYVRQGNVHWFITRGYPNGNDKTAVFPPEQQDRLRPDSSGRFVTGAGIWLNHIWSPVVNGVLGPQQSGQTRYAWTYVYSPKSQTVGALIEFYNYSRSDYGLTPRDGEWDNMGSRLWVNDEDLHPNFSWDNAGRYIGRGDMEVDLGNLNFPTRRPVSVRLRRGWNKVLLKLPYVSVAGQCRPNKWQFTFVLTTQDGRQAVPGLIYSPQRKRDKTQ